MIKRINLIATVSCLLIISCNESSPDLTESVSPTVKPQVLVQEENTSINCGAFCEPPSVTYNLPADACNLTAQNVINCFAWSSFLALNWAASSHPGAPDKSVPASDYAPGDMSPTVWESYISVEELFAGEADMVIEAYKNSGYTKQFAQLSKIVPALHDLDESNLREEDAVLDELFQAHGTWLTDQSGNLVWYEVRVDTTESDFIHDNQLYEYAALKSYGKANKGVWLPTGSMELKAAWKVVPAADVDAAKPYYKLSEALVPEIEGFTQGNNPQPIFGKYTKQTVALVGLHIIRKTESAPNFIWATFEHIHNAPTEGKVDPNISYSFYDKNSTALPNQSPVPSQDSLNSPVQVERIATNTITDEINLLNKQVHGVIRASNPNSVWQYYRLVNVQWPQSPIADSSNNTKVPLKKAGITPSNIANVTMETYIQNKECMDCHQYGSVNNTTIPTDYSFLFLRVKESQTGLKTPTEVLHKKVANPVFPSEKSLPENISLSELKEYLDKRM